jgi:uncharacterized protein (TIGR00297 family)
VTDLTVALAGAGLALVVSLAALRSGSLSPSGVVAATMLGTVAVLGGWSWAVLLVAYFVLGSAVSHAGAARKAARTLGVVAKGGARDGVQVAANGLAFGVAAAAALVWPAHATQLMAAGAGALAASAADTWGTEVGTALGRTPRMLHTLRRVPPGTSGAVSAAGWAGTLAGALVLALLVAAVGWGWPVARAALVGGVAGAVADSLLGALVQERRWCERCSQATEQPVHRCGTPTTHAGGVAGVGNDLVNLACTLVGAGAAASLVPYS